MKLPSKSLSEEALLVLVSVADGPKHGYAMIQDILRLAGRRLGPGTLYGALARLDELGYVEPLRADDRRTPYRLTEKGSQVLRALLNRQRRIAAAGMRRLSAE
jgi:DNA-binding PadR family transcriptional regulator